MVNFKELQKDIRQERGYDNWIPPKGLLAIDPGMTTGWAYFKEGGLYDYGQVKASAKDVSSIYSLIDNLKLDVIVIEDYRVYSNKASSHISSSLETPRIIGALQAYLYIKDIPYHFQMASMAKGFCDKKKLKEWGYWAVGKQHSRDAIRHGCTWLLFSNTKTER